MQWRARGTALFATAAGAFGLGRPQSSSNLGQGAGGLALQVVGGQKAGQQGWGRVGLLIQLGQPTRAPKPGRPACPRAPCEKIGGRVALVP